MPIEQSILVATDLSARCDRAMDRAIMLARDEQKSLIVLHVHEGKTQLAPNDETRMRNLISSEFGLAEDNVKIVFEHGPVPATIAKVAAERNCDLIVTGVARFNSPDDFVFGTAVDYVVRKSPAPVLVVKRRAIRPYKQLVMPVDFSDDDTCALVEAARLFSDAQFLLVHAYETAFDAFLEHDSTAGMIRRDTEASMERLIAQLPDSLKDRLETEAMEGSLYEVLARAIAKKRADLLVLGSEAPRGGYTHVATGDDTWHVPASEPCDLLVIKGNPQVST